MAFTDTWDAAFEAAPADSEDINLGANRIRHLKVAVRERMEVDHVWEDDQEDGKHNKLTLVPQSGAPTVVDPNGYLYSQIIGDRTELFYEDNFGNISQITQGGKLYPFAIGDFSVGEDLAVANNCVIGETTSFAADFISGFAAFASGNDAVLQFSTSTGGTYITFNTATGKMLFVVEGAVALSIP